MLIGESIIRGVHEFIESDNLGPGALALDHPFHEIIFFEINDQLVPGFKLGGEDLFDVR